MKQQHYVEAAKRLLELSELSDTEHDTLGRIEEIFSDLKVHIVPDEDDYYRGWHMSSVSDITVEGSDLLEVSVKLWQADTKRAGRAVVVARSLDTKTIETTLEPPFETDGEPHIEEYGGIGKKQQSLVITVVDRDDSERSASIQLDINPYYGRFIDSRLHGWEVTDTGEDEDNDNE